MLARIHLFLLLATLVAAPVLGQVQPSATGGNATTEDDTQMMTPPPVNGVPYPTEATAARPNYFKGSLAAEVAYIDNVLPGSTTIPVSDTTYTVLSDISFTKKKNTPSTPSRA